MIRRKIMLLGVLVLVAGLLLGSSLAMASEHFDEATLTVFPDIGVNIVPDHMDHTVIATLTLDNEPLAGVLVTFAIVSGPNAAMTEKVLTDEEGQATFTYTYMPDPPVVGDDRIRVTTPFGQEAEVSKTWLVADPITEPPPPVEPPVPPPVEPPAPPPVEPPLPVEPPEPAPVVPGVTGWGLLAAAIAMGLLLPMVLKNRLAARA